MMSSFVSASFKPQLCSLMKDTTVPCCFNVFTPKKLHVTSPKISIKPLKPGVGLEGGVI